MEMVLLWLLNGDIQTVAPSTQGRGNNMGDGCARLTLRTRCRGGGGVEDGEALA